MNDEIKEEFEECTKDVELQFRKQKITESDVKKAVQWARKPPLE